MSALNKSISSLCTLLGTGAPVILTTQLLTSSLKKHDQEHSDTNIEEISVNFPEEKIEPSKPPQQRTTQSSTKQSSSAKSSSTGNSASGEVSDISSLLPSGESVGEEQGVSSKPSEANAEEKTPEIQPKEPQQESDSVPKIEEDDSENQEAITQPTKDEEKPSVDSSGISSETKEENEESITNISDGSEEEQKNNPAPQKSIESETEEIPKTPVANRTLKKSVEEQLKRLLEKLLENSN